MRHRRWLFSIVLAFSLTSLSGSIVYAGNPHFRTVSAQLGSPRLTISGIEVGLGAGATVSYEASASVTTTAAVPQRRRQESVGLQQGIQR